MILDMTQSDFANNELLLYHHVHQRLQKVLDFDRNQDLKYVRLP